MSWGEAQALWWLPTAAVVVMTALGIVAVAAQSARPAKKYWLAALVVVGAVAIGASTWRQQSERVALGDETARLRQLAMRLDALGRLLPAGPGKTPEATFDTLAAAIRVLNDKVRDLESQVDTLREQTRNRAIAPQTAAKLAAYLRPFGSRRVVVSCAPDDVEAYDYANQIANVLRQAGWDASGPEKTTIFGEAPAMGIRLFVHTGAAAPDTAKILIDAFTRFNIPFESGLSPSGAIPDPDTTELFFSHKP
jgi:outer membrane murein-binding lipoprotein Lpp